jgi:ABC-type cobalamin/Fe3+-siderophores transport system ATPase subunit
MTEISKKLIEIEKNYRKIKEMDKGAKFVKVDLHIHTPASGDAQAKTKYNYKFSIYKKDKKTKKSYQELGEEKEKQRKIAEEIVEKCQKENLGIIAITDHNSPSSIDPESVSQTWYGLISEVAKNIDLLVLPGVEISTDDLHILVILNPKQGKEPLIHNIHRINFLLRDCKFSLEDCGDYRATGMSSLFDVLEYIERLGTSAIVIPAHIDGGNKAMLDVYNKPSNIYKKLLNHSNLNSVEVVKLNILSKKLCKKPLKEYFDKMRDEDKSPLSYVQNSDAHSVDKIGKRFTYIRMGQPSFWTLKNALEEPETRVRRMEENGIFEMKDKTKIVGIAFKKPKKKWKHIAFNEGLNCIIGKRKTGKSTIIDLILYGLNRFKEENIDEKESQDWLIKQGFSVNVFVEKNSNVYCYSRQNKELPNIFEIKNNQPKEINGKKLKNLKLELPRKYNHKIITETFSNKEKRRNFLDKHIFQNKLCKCEEKRDKVIERINKKLIKQGKTFQDCCESDIQKIKKVCNNLFKTRKEIAEKELKNYGEKFKKNIFGLGIKKGNWNNNKKLPSKIYQDEKKKELNEYFLDKVDMKLLGNNKKYKNMNRLSVGEENACIMVLLMNQEVFGPLILDEPEKHLDASSLTRILIPRMRKLKTQQQIICVTKDEHILFSGDGEQVLVTQKENELKIVAGDINSQTIQKQILDIFEGGRSELLRKNRKLKGIIE